MTTYSEDLTNDPPCTPEEAEEYNICTLVYAYDGFAWIRYGSLDKTESRPGTGDLSGKSSPRAVFNTLQAAYVEAFRKGHRPTHWTRPVSGASRLRIDHAAHWLRLAGLEGEAD